MSVVGRHVYGSLYECDVQRLSDRDYLERLVAQAVEESNNTLVDIHSWEFPAGDTGLKGVSVIALVLESHIAVHTWTEHAYATVDVYTCGERSNPLRGFMVIAEGLRARHVEYHVVDRSLKSHAPHPRER